MTVTKLKTKYHNMDDAMQGQLPRTNAVPCCICPGLAFLATRLLQHALSESLLRVIKFDMISFIHKQCCRKIKPGACAASRDLEVQKTPPQIPNYIRESLVCRGIWYFSSFCSKHWSLLFVRIRNASVRRFQWPPEWMFWNISKKNILIQKSDS